MASLMERAAQPPTPMPPDTGGMEPPQEDSAKNSTPFKKPDISQFVPPEMKDVVDRIVAAGHKIMYSPDMRAELQKAVQSPDPVPKKLAENVTGLLLVVDKKSRGGLPQEAIFPAGMELLGEAAEVLQTAGQPVSQEDFNEGVRTLYVMMGKKLGASDEQIMQGAEQALQPDAEEAGEPPDMQESAEPPAEEMA